MDELKIPDRHKTRYVAAYADRNNVDTPTYRMNYSRHDAVVALTEIIEDLGTAEAALAAKERELAALRAKVERLEAPVSDEEWLDNSVCESHDYRNRADRSQVDALLAARSKPQEAQ